MSENDHAPTQSLRFGRLHVVLTEDIQHLAANVSGHLGDDQEGEGKGGQDRIRKDFPATGGEDPHLNPDIIGEEGRQHETGNGYTQHGNDRRCIVQPGPPLDRRHRSQQNSDQPSENQPL